MPPTGQESGAASHGKIGGDREGTGCKAAQGEPRLPVDAGSARGWQGADDNRVGCKRLKENVTTPLRKTGRAEVVHKPKPFEKSISRAGRADYKQVRAAI